MRASPYRLRPRMRRRRPRIRPPTPILTATPSIRERSAGALSGAADVISAQGQYLISQQQSRLVSTQADMSRLKYRNALIEQQALREVPEAEGRRNARAAAVAPTRNRAQQPDQSGYLVGQFRQVNSLLKAMQQGELQGLKADPVPLPADILKHLNFTTGDKLRRRCGDAQGFQQLAMAVRPAERPFPGRRDKDQRTGEPSGGGDQSGGRVSAANVQQPKQLRGAMKNMVASNQTLSPSDWIESKSFLSNLMCWCRSLRNPDVAQYFNGGYSPKAKTVGELVSELTAKGLHFAPATQGISRPTSRESLRTYDYRLASTATLSTAPH